MTDLELDTLDKWIQRDDTRLALRVLETKRPSVWNGSTPADTRLHQIQGWELCRNNLMNLLGRVEKVETIQEEYQTPEI